MIVLEVIKVHILWTPSWYPSRSEPLNGSFFAEQRQMLVAAGHRVGVINLNSRSFWQWSQQVLRTNLDGNILRRDILTIPLELFPGDVARIRRLARKLGRQYEKTHGIPDVIHAHSAFPGILVASALSEQWKVPFVFTEHRPSSLQRNRAKERYRAIREAVHLSSSNITVSQEMAGLLGRYYETQDFLVSTLPASDSFLAQPLRKHTVEEFVFLHVSHMDRNKRVEETIRAFQEICRDHPGTILRLLGGTQERVKELRSSCVDKRYEDRVEFLGQVPREDIAHWMSTGDCLILLSERESGGIVMAEAQCLGMPVIATATAGGKFMVAEETGIIVPIDHHDAVVSAMVEMLDRAKRGTIDAESIRQKAKKRFSREVFLAFHENVYTQAIDSMK